METTGILGFIQGFQGYKLGYVGIMEKMEATIQGLSVWLKPAEQSEDLSPTSEEIGCLVRVHPDSLWVR